MRTSGPAKRVHSKSNNFLPSNESVSRREIGVRYVVVLKTGTLAIQPSSQPATPCVPLFFSFSFFSTQSSGYRDYVDGAEKYAPGVWQPQSRRGAPSPVDSPRLAPDEFLIADEEKERPWLRVDAAERKKKKVYRYRSLNNTLSSPNPEVKARVRIRTVG